MKLQESEKEGKFSWKGNAPEWTEAAENYELLCEDINEHHADRMHQRNIHDTPTVSLWSYFHEHDDPYSSFVSYKLIESCSFE